MKSILTHTVVAVIAIILTSLLMKQCSPVTTVTKTVTTVDTLYTERVVETTDTIYKLVTRVKHDTIYRHVPVPVDTVSEGIYAYDEFYQDSSYRVSGNIMYEGLIKRHDQMFTVLKDRTTFIPTTRTVFATRDIVKVTNITRQPRILAGAYLTGDKFSLQQAGVKVTVVDNKFRQYSIGKDVLKKNTWYFGADVPLFYSKFR